MNPQNVDGRQANNDARQPNFAGRQSILDRQSTFDGRKPQVDGRPYNIDGRQSNYDGRQSNCDSRNPQIDGRQANTDGRQPTSSNVRQQRYYYQNMPSRSNPNTIVPSCNGQPTGQMRTQDMNPGSNSQDSTNDSAVSLTVDTVDGVGCCKPSPESLKPDAPKRVQGSVPAKDTAGCTAANQTMGEGTDSVDEVTLSWGTSDSCPVTRSTSGGSMDGGQMNERYYNERSPPRDSNKNHSQRMAQYNPCATQNQGNYCCVPENTNNPRGFCQPMSQARNCVRPCNDQVCPPAEKSQKQSKKDRADQPVAKKEKHEYFDCNKTYENPNYNEYSAFGRVIDSPPLNAQNNHPSRQNPKRSFYQDNFYESQNLSPPPSKRNRPKRSKTNKKDSAAQKSTPAQSGFISECLSYLKSFLPSDDENQSSSALVDPTASPDDTSADHSIELFYDRQLIAPPVPQNGQNVSRGYYPEDGVAHHNVIAQTDGHPETILLIQNANVYFCRNPRSRGRKARSNVGEYSTSTSNRSQKTRSNNKRKHANRRRKRKDRSSKSDGSPDGAEKNNNRKDVLTSKKTQTKDGRSDDSPEKINQKTSNNKQKESRKASIPLEWLRKYADRLSCSTGSSDDSDSRSGNDPDCVYSCAEILLNKESSSPSSREWKRQRKK